MPYVVRTVTLPTTLLGIPNGRVPDTLLETIGPSGRLHHTAARAWRALRAAAHDAGFELTWTFGGTYRTYAQQESLFRLRYSPTGTFGGCKTWNGQRWCLKGNYAMAAVPGTSNHGYGLAVDAALDLDPTDGVNPEDAVSIMPAIPWLVANAERFGWSWEAQSEPWHLRYTRGDAVPQAVLDFERPPPPPPDEEEDDMALDKIVKPSGPWTQPWWPWLACFTSGTVRPAVTGENAAEVVVNDEGQYRRLCAAAGIQLTNEKP